MWTIFTEANELKSQKKISKFMETNHKLIFSFFFSVQSQVT